MPTLTRDQKFKKSFPLFFDYLTSDDNFPELTEYRLENLPFNCKKKLLSEANYNFIIPRKVVEYYVDTYIVDENGSITLPGPVMRNQPIPPYSDIVSKFNEYFDEFTVRKNNVSVSYVVTRMLSEWNHDTGSYYINKDGHRIPAENVKDINDVSEYDLVLGFYISYYKSELPFPVIPTSKQQFEQKCSELEKKNAELEKKIDHLTLQYGELLDTNNDLRRTKLTERREIENKYRSLFERMQKKFAEYYSEKKEKDNCPVCYEVINSEKLRVPGCCHTICTDCAGKCNKCPICRESY